MTLNTQGRFDLSHTSLFSEISVGVCGTIKKTSVLSGLYENWMGSGYWIKNTDTHRTPRVCSSTENDWDWDNSEGPSSFRVKAPKCLLSTYLAKRELGCVVDAVLNRTFELRLREWGSWLGMWISERRSSTNSAHEHVTTLKDTHVQVFQTLCRTPDLSSFMDCSLHFFSSLFTAANSKYRQNLSKTPVPTYSHSITTKFPAQMSLPFTDL